MSKMRILVAPLNWGLGHATRCIPIIQKLLRCNYEPVIASDGEALEILRKEFPNLRHLNLPSYNIQYTKRGYLLKWKIILDSSRIHRVIAEEKNATEKIVSEYKIEAIISDNRFGVYSDQLKTNVFITHQINVLSGWTTCISSYFNRQHLKNFDQCWIPDFKGTKNLSGIIGHSRTLPGNCQYIGPLSRFEEHASEEIFDYLILLSGPEPQRTLLEEILLQKFQKTDLQILFVRGVFNEKPIKNDTPNFQIENYLFGKQLENAVNSSKAIIARSGYTTVMDLCKLNKKAFFIPTPGQEEQQYLAKRLEKEGMVPYCQQQDFDLALLTKIKDYSGLRNFGKRIRLRDFFTFFHRE